MGSTDNGGSPFLSLPWTQANLPLSSRETDGYDTRCGMDIVPHGSSVDPVSDAWDLSEWRIVVVHNSIFAEVGNELECILKSTHVFQFCVSAHLCLSVFLCMRVSARACLCVLARVLARASACVCVCVCETISLRIICYDQQCQELWQLRDSHLFYCRLPTSRLPEDQLKRIPKIRRVARKIQTDSPARSAESGSSPFSLSVL